MAASAIEMTATVIASLLAALWFGQSQNAAPSSTPSRMEIVLERREPKGAKVVDPRHIFSNGELIRFRFKTNFPGYLYVMNRSTSGKYTLLFPNEETGQNNRIKPATEYLLPATKDGWFRIEGPSGYEVVYWLMSPTDMGHRDGLQIPYIQPLPEPKPGEIPPGMTPRCDDTVLRARGDCVDMAAGAKPIPKGEMLPENLAQVSEAADRDLIFMRKQNLSMVSSPGPLGGPVLYEFHLAHK